MHSHCTDKFWGMYRRLPAYLRKEARRKYAIWRQNPWHPSLEFKPVSRKRSIWSVRVNDQTRALGVKAEDGTFIWFWIGQDHDQYERGYAW